jgi:hypothetical protein
MAEATWGRFLERHTYNRRRDIHAVYGGQQQGGICTPSDHKVIFLFTGETGEQHGYGDGWTDDGVFRYFGEGQQDGKDLLVFTGGLMHQRGDAAGPRKVCCANFIASARLRWPIGPSALLSDFS